MNSNLPRLGEIILQVFATIVVVVGLMFWMWRSRERGAIVGRVVATVILTLVLIFVIGPIYKQGDGSIVLAVIFTMAWGWCLAIIWVPAITGSLGGLFGSLYDGGGGEVEAKPFYSIFKTKRLQGKYFEAQTEIRRQLHKFPMDFEGMMLLASLQAENLDDLPGAEVTVERVCRHPGQTPPNIAYALTQLADWHLQLTKDRDAAQCALEKIIELLPNTEMSQRASQRIAHLADTEMLLATHDRQKLSVKKGIQNLGLVRENGKLKLPEADLAKEAADYTAHLEAHPHDNHAREKLAVLYAQHFHRLDLAADQLEQLITYPSHTPKQIVHWLNLLADLQVQEGGTAEQVRVTLQRIVDDFPGVPAADNARRRIDLLKHEMKSKQAGPAVSLGVYEQNIGLKRKR